MIPSLTFCWILDSGGAGRGAWQGGLIYELMLWAREHGCSPHISMGASAGGYAAADVCTETEATVMKGWTHWGRERFRAKAEVPPEHHSFWGRGEFRLHLRSSIQYVMGAGEVAAVFNRRPGKKLLIFTTRLRRRDDKPITKADITRYFLKSLTRKLPRSLKYLPRIYHEDPIIFAAPLPDALQSEWVRPLTRENYHSVIEASCLVPLAMGFPLLPHEINHGAAGVPGDTNAVFLDGGFAMKMPMALFDEDTRFQPVARWASAHKTLVFCCDPKGRLWETSSRMRMLNSTPSVKEAICGRRLMIICPDHKVEASFLSRDNQVIMRTFRRGQEQAGRLLQSKEFRRFVEE